MANESYLWNTNPSETKASTCFENIFIIYRVYLSMFRGISPPKFRNFHPEMKSDRGLSYELLFYECFPPESGTPSPA